MIKMLKKILGIMAFYLPPPLPKYIHKFRGVKIKDMSCLFIGTNVDIDHVFPQNITIGSNVTVSSGVRITSHSEPPRSIQEKYLPASSEKIVVGDNVYIGADSIILPGVKIGDWTVIGAGSVVTKDVLEYNIVAGNPAKIIGDLRGHKKGTGQ